MRSNQTEELQVSRSQNTTLEVKANKWTSVIARIVDGRTIHHAVGKQAISGSSSRRDISKIKWPTQKSEHPMCRHKSKGLR